MRIGIIGAMDEEIELFQEGMSHLQQKKKASILFYEGEMNGKSVVLCKSGIGKVNAAVTTQILIDEFKVDRIIFTGVAGALHPDLDIGDIVISTAAQQHDVDVTPLGYEKGIIPDQEKSVFEADQQLISLAKKASEEVNEGKVFTGLILSGDQFIADRDQVRELYETYDGMCTEMEGASVAQVCHMNLVPFVIIRSMSDKADGSAHVNFVQFTRLASKRSYQIVDKMLKMMEG
ncbi:5'-methylthioadenosine/adenosylhomocysteine nucleosidase [Tepidibacillus fermentans]|uniref:adenosylhomocysteine nucleosidase n=1 Tax=Tepidibacillus fermentans TaxID=1281767 RepID=A0A4R3KF83_9BACI|nr:5'-methylthioadenosine/adenosylhomocysteine nucleosidase [Tepidibacillus fermentans]TCS81301.1 adenosylhomocysteine nucleosidase [Tepidibacillus fermentans]